MPVYSFKCSNCTLTFEKILKPLVEEVTCPSCNGFAIKLPPKNVLGKMGEVTSMPKDIDLAVGADSDKKWEEYEERKSIKDKVRKETNSDWISRDLDGEYAPLTVVKDKSIVTGEEARNIRNEMWNEIKNPDIEKTGDAEEERAFKGF